jgi:hypothetical protein
MARYTIRGSGFPLLVAAIALTCAGCSGHAVSAIDSAAGAGSLAPPDAAADQDAEAIPDALSFERVGTHYTKGGTLLLAPADKFSVTVHASPSQPNYRVRFALVENAKDASLNRSETPTSEDGDASVTLTAPSSESAFILRASVGTEVKADLRVSVSKDGYATLELKPIYAGVRPIAGWVASIHPDADCSSLQGVPYTDGSFVTKVGSNDTAVLEDVPIGKQFAATLRSAQLAGGCIDTGKLSAGTVTELNVPILDRPMQLEALELGLVLGVDNSFRAWVDAMNVAIEPAVVALRGTAHSDIQAFMDALQEAVAPELGIALSEVRAKGGWDSALSESLDLAGSPLSDTVRQWLEAAAEASATPKLFSAVLTAGSADDDPSELSLVSVAGLDPGVAGFARLNAASLTADPSDALLFGSSLYWLPSQFLAELVAQMLAQQAPGLNPAVALADKLDCSKAATYLSSDKTFEAAGCNTSCAQELCQKAMDRLWTRVRNDSAAALRAAQLELSATNTVDFDEEARPRGVAGTWVGTVTQGDNTISVKGTTSGSALD